MNKTLRFFLPFLLLIVTTVFCVAQDSRAEAALAKLDRFNRQLNTLSADILQKKYVNLLGEFDESEHGKLYFRRQGKSAQLRKEIQTPGQVILVISGSDLTVYYPKKNQAVKRKLGEHQAGYAAFGIGATTEEIRKNFRVTFGGEEKVDGKTAQVLDLLPTNPKIKGYFKALRLWVDAQTGMPVRQQIGEHNGDYTQIQLVRPEVNGKVPERAFELKLPKNVEIL